MQLADKFEKFTLKTWEFEAIEKGLRTFKIFLHKIGYNRLASKIVSFNNIYKLTKDNKGGEHYTVIDYVGLADFTNELAIFSDQFIADTYADFGCFLVSWEYIYFPVPLFVTHNKICPVWIVSVKNHLDFVDTEFLIAMSEMYKKKVPKEKLFEALSEYFGKEKTAIFLGISLSVNYYDVLKEVLSERYSVTIEKTAQRANAFTMAIYNTWEWLLSSNVLEMEPVKKLWGMTRYKTKIEGLDAIRELKYIELNTPSILTYANLYEKGIESDFGQAILKTLENKKEAESLEKTLSPMEKHIADVRGIPYEVPETGKDVINFIDYKKIYQSVLDDIFRKLRAGV